MTYFYKLFEKREKDLNKKNIRNYTKLYSRAALWRLFLLLIFTLIYGILPGQAETIREIVFPIDGEYQPFGDSYGDPRSDGRSHEGIDILADRMTPLVAVVDGVVTFAPVNEPYWGYALHIQDNEGWEYRYLHINNDTPGTDDNAGGFTYAFAPGISQGVSVTQGQLVSYVGDSGNAEYVTPHLHFEIRQPGGWSGASVNPYPSLLAALNGSVSRIDYNPLVALEAAPSISINRRLEPPLTPPLCPADSLIKTPDSAAVYYCGTDSKRYVFPNDKVFFTWYDDFSEINEISVAELAAIPLVGNVTYRPGVSLVKITTDPKVYAVDSGGALRWVKTPEIAVELYGSDWADKVDDIPDTFFINYQISLPIGE
jgi:murein DD-endopeptidase MepM/ murein hydrolase activator NlpD